MSNVALTIGGRDYAVSCDAGEETHLRELGAMIEAKIAQAGGSQQGEARALLFAALLLADEVFDLRRQSAGANNGHAPLPMMPRDQLDVLAERLEAVADAIEGSATRVS